MYAQGVNRFEGTLGAQVRMVTVRRLETLFATGVTPKADFLKVDVEGCDIAAQEGEGDAVDAALSVSPHGGVEAAPRRRVFAVGM